MAAALVRAATRRPSAEGHALSPARRVSIGFATGLLGFAQIYWDSNRQAIHDRIVGTVVVRDGAKKVRDWGAMQ